MEKDAETHSQILGGAKGEFCKSWRRGSIEGVGGVKDTTRRRLTESSNLGPCGLTETEPLAKKNPWAGHRPSVHLEHVCNLITICVTKNWRGGLSLILLPAIGSPSPSLAALPGLSGIGCTWSCGDLMCSHGWGMGVFYFSEA